MTAKALLGMFLLFALQSPATADPDPATMSIVRDEDLVWKESPTSPGLKTAVVYGDTAKAGLYIVRVRFAPGTMSRPHFHPEERCIVVLKGTWWVGAGPKWDKDATTPLPPGSFVVHYPNRIHYDGAKGEEVTLQISGIGPSRTTPVDENGQAK